MTPEQPDVVSDISRSTTSAPVAPVRPIGMPDWARVDFSWDVEGDVVRDLLLGAWSQAS